MCTHHFCARQGRTVDVTGLRAELVDQAVWNQRISLASNGKPLLAG